MFDRLLEAFKDGLELAVKWGLLVLIVLYAYNSYQETKTMAVNGQQAAIAIKEFQDKGWLPKFPVPVRVEDNK